MLTKDTATGAFGVVYGEEVRINKRISIMQELVALVRRAVLLTHLLTFNSTSKTVCCLTGTALTDRGSNLERYS